MKHRAQSSAIALFGLLIVELFCILQLRDSGFLAISDDDYARVVIAQQFVEAPQLDPSGTSWLPFPFLFYGSVMRLFGAELETARHIALLLSLASSTLLFALARSLRLTPFSAALFASACTILPSILPLASAVVPEYPTAALLCVGGLSLLHPARSRWRLIGACALFLACASRYEAWPVAATCGAISLYDLLAPGLRSGQKPAKQQLLLAAGIALPTLLFPILWMAHGARHHQDALFFVARVSAYKAALGDALPGFADLALGYPVALLRHEPELTLSLVCLLVSSAVLGLSAPVGRTRLFWVAGSQLLFLVLGAARGGAPTHHPERALIACWMLGLFVSAERLDALRRALKWYAALPLLLGAGTGLILRLAQASAFDNYAWRAAEEATGKAIAALDADNADGPHAQDLAVALALPDFGYFAVMAAAGKVERFSVLQTNDPRHKEQGLDLQAALTEKQLCLFVVPTPNAPTLAGNAPPLAIPQSSVLFESSHSQLRRLDAPFCD